MKTLVGNKYLMAASLAVFMAFIFMNAATALPELSAVQDENGVDVYVGKVLFTRYKTEETQKYPYFYPVNGPLSGHSVTTESSEPYPHHASLFFGCDKVNGGNYWQESLSAGQIRSVALEVVKGDGEAVILENTCEWSKPGQDPIMRDKRRITITAPEAVIRVIDFEITLIPLTGIRIGRTNHALFAARMKPELSVASGGSLVNAQGDRGEAETFGKQVPWCDYYGEHNGATEGLAIFQHPMNPLYPHPWFTRDYGFFSPSPMYWPPNESHFEFSQDETIHLKYRVIIHEGDTESARIAERFEHYAGETNMPVTGDMP